MKEFLCNPAIWLTLTSIFIAFIALFQTQKQIKLSNKHQLFDRRINIYITFMDFIETVKSRFRILKMECPKNGLSLDETSELFLLLTSSQFFEDIDTLMCEPVNLKYEKIFLNKIDEIQIMVNSLKFVFPIEISEYMSNFIKSYTDAIFSVYRYRLLFVDVKPDEYGKIIF